MKQTRIWFDLAAAAAFIIGLWLCYTALNGTQGQFHATLAVAAFAACAALEIAGQGR